MKMIVAVYRRKYYLTHKNNYEETLQIFQKILGQLKKYIKFPYQVFWELFIFLLLCFMKNF